MEEFGNAAITGHFGFVFEENSDREMEKSYGYRDAIAIEKLRFQNVFFSHENEKPALSNSFGLKSVNL